MKLQQIKYCAEECARQKSGELSVYWMARALEMLLIDVNQSINETLILNLGALVEPEKNLRGFRHTSVRFADYSFAPDAEIIPDAITSLCNAGLTAAEFYQEFEEIHPFIDGNGRVGSLLFNLINKTLDNPIKPPIFKKKL